jgi:acyl-CoA thioesterase II
LPVVYTVEIVRNGQTFATRTVRALQRGAVIFVLTALFQRSEPSPFHHARPSPVHRVPAPESLCAPTPEEYAQAVYEKIVKDSDRLARRTKVPPIVAQARENGDEFIKNLSAEFAQQPILFRYVSNEDIKEDSLSEYRQYVWFKANGTISSDPQTHLVALAYASDRSLLSTCIRSHEAWSAADFGVLVSLDHIIYFHDVRCILLHFLMGVLGGQSGRLVIV